MLNLRPKLTYYFLYLIIIDIFAIFIYCYVFCILYEMMKHVVYYSFKKKQVVYYGTGLVRSIWQDIN